ncbi:MAG: hypothetical protein M1541_11000 [Acidobacteria bacterium]|nr:hypothetical protein [Acidobacteriota bacterium]
MFIVTSRLADDALWAEVLNVDGYDLLLKPFRGEEVVRMVNAAATQIPPAKANPHQASEILCRAE